MICPNCGSNNPDGTAFCANCGSPVSNGAPNNGAIPPQAQPNFQGSAPNGGMTPPPVFNGNPFPGGHIEQRNIALCIILSIITCGIYGLVFLYSMIQDVNTVCDGDGEHTRGLMGLILLSLVTCGIYSFYWYYCLGNRLAKNAPRYGMSFQENGTTVLLWMVIGSLLCGLGSWVANYIIIKNCNQLCAAYNRAHGI